MTDLDIAFTMDGDWATVIAVTIFVLGNWIGGPVLGGVVTRERFAAYDRAVEASGWFVVSSMGLLWGITLIMQILLAIAWIIYLVEDAAAAPNEFFYIVINFLIFFGTIFYMLAEYYFWRAAAFAWSLGLRLLGWLMYLVALGFLIWEIVEITNDDPTDETGSNIFLTIVVGIAIIIGLFVGVPRTWAYWQAAGLVAASAGAALLEESESRAPQRASQAAYVMNKAK